MIVWMRGAGLSPGRQSDRQEDLNPDSSADDHLLDAIQTTLERSIAIIRTAHVHGPPLGRYAHTKWAAPPMRRMPGACTMVALLSCENRGQRS